MLYNSPWHANAVIDDTLPSNFRSDFSLSGRLQIMICCFYEKKDLLRQKLVSKIIDF